MQRIKAEDFPRKPAHLWSKPEAKDIVAQAMMLKAAQDKHKRLAKQKRTVTIRREE